MTTIKQMLVEHDGVLCLAIVPPAVQGMILNLLRVNESGEVQIVKLPEDIKLVELSKRGAGDE